MLTKVQTLGDKTKEQNIRIYLTRPKLMIPMKYVAKTSLLLCLTEPYSKQPTLPMTPFCPMDTPTPTTASNPSHTLFHPPQTSLYSHKTGSTTHVVHPQMGSSQYT
uniref:Uncharacterized protein n=1 Tax=Helianthus annuus TaxID=4232 RepID=A0A251S294_HELAN